MKRDVAEFNGTFSDDQVLSVVLVSHLQDSNMTDSVWNDIDDNWCNWSVSWTGTGCVRTNTDISQSVTAEIMGSCLAKVGCKNSAKSELLSVLAWSVSPHAGQPFLVINTTHDVWTVFSRPLNQSTTLFRLIFNTDCQPYSTVHRRWPGFSSHHCSTRHLLTLCSCLPVPSWYSTVLHLVSHLLVWTVFVQWLSIIGRLRYVHATLPWFTRASRRLE